MAGLKYYERTVWLVEMIEKKRTGNPDRLASKLGICKRQVYNVIDELKTVTGKNIVFSREEESYVFFEEK
ncbi:hypothetical protein [Negadavirga shengliensis]|uniref:HTH domain-containing protein n=1 Tax=Negadavirga shengliensis TaxID=1389218 RepID=A0ABV9T246_9BACT